MRSRRKDEHVALALAQDEFEHDFDRMRLVHQSLPGFDLNEVSLKSHFFEHNFDLPVYINAMTGGSERTKEYNRKLALLARRYNLPMAVGSQHAALDDETLEDSYRVIREVNPNGFVLGNINPNASVTEAQRAIDMIGANALQIHINPAQELTMDEGDRHFSHWSTNIKAIVESVDVPVIVKEVGNGVSRETVAKLKDLGVKHVDVSGRGGTNFVWIENKRSENKRYDTWTNWGLTTLEALIDNSESDVELLASGGINSALDVIKALVLGAKGVGMSGYFLRLVEAGNEDSFEMFIEDLKKLMVLVDAKDIAALKDARYILK